MIFTQCPYVQSQRPNYPVWPGKVAPQPGFKEKWKWKDKSYALWCKFTHWCKFNFSWLQNYLAQPFLCFCPKEVCLTMRDGVMLKNRSGLSERVDMEQPSDLSGQVTPFSPILRVMKLWPLRNLIATLCSSAIRAEPGKPELMHRFTYFVLVSHDIAASSTLSCLSAN